MIDEINTCECVLAGKQASGIVHPLVVRGTASTCNGERTPLLQPPPRTPPTQRGDECDTYEVLEEDDRHLENFPPGSPPSTGLSPPRGTSAVADLISVNTFESSCESFVHKSTTASMTNFIEFGDSNTVLSDIECTGAGTGTEIAYLESAGTGNVAAGLESTDIGSDNPFLDTR